MYQHCNMSATRYVSSGQVVSPDKAARKIGTPLWELPNSSSRMHHWSISIFLVEMSFPLGERPQIVQNTTRLRPFGAYRYGETQGLSQLLRSKMSTHTHTFHFHPGETNMLKGRTMKEFSEFSPATLVQIISM